jgi:hypothetical protein
MGRLTELASFTARSLFYLTRDRWLQRRSRPLPKREEWAREILAKGYVLVPEFKPRSWCAAAINELAMTDKSSTTFAREDTRIFGAEKKSTHAAEFANDPQLLDLASWYARSDVRLLFCMANKVVHKPGVEHGSGGEWHRDGFGPEIKALVYLTDVSESDGPFALLAGSHRSILRDTLKLGWAMLCGHVSGLQATRLKDAGERLGRKQVITAKAGTLILFDTSAIHTGTPPQPGAERLALTNYYISEKAYDSTLDYYRRYVVLN